MNELKTCYNEKNLKMTTAICCEDSSTDLFVVRLIKMILLSEFNCIRRTR